MQIRWMTLGISLSLLLAACEGGTAAPITPAPDRPTFLFFYTEG